MRSRGCNRLHQFPAALGAQAAGRAGTRSQAAGGALKLIATLLLLVIPALGLASDARPSSLRLQVDLTSVSGEWKIPVADLDTALRLDADRNGEVSWQELEPRRADIENHLLSQVRIRVNGEATTIELGGLVYGAQGGEPLILSHLGFGASKRIERLDVETSQRCALTVVWLGQGMHTAVLSAGDAVGFTRESAASYAFVELLQTGIWHIWTGYDHVLFLLVLLIPAVFQRTNGGREAVPRFADAFLRVTVIVTAFTVAHSLTLTSAAMHWINLPSRLVESAIAASIFVAAVLNFLPTTAGSRGAWLAFGFGLLHGFGFAGAMSEIDLAGAPLWHSLLAFNLGVEAGQLAIVAAFLPLAFFLRNTRFYRTGVVYGGSTLAGLCAAAWFWHRAF